MSRYCLPLLLAITWCACDSDAHAQRRIPNYSRNPSISPYVNLFRGNTGGVNSYFTFVRPIQDQARVNQMQQTQSMLLQQQLLQQQMGLPPQAAMRGGMMRGAGTQRLQMAAGGASMGAMQAGASNGPMMMQSPRFQSTAASYFNYSHFYGVPVSNPGTFAGGR